MTLVIGLADEHGDEIDGRITVRCRANGVEVPVERIEKRWRVRYVAENDVAFDIDAPSERALDVLGVRTGVIPVRTAASGMALLRHFRDIHGIAIQEDFGATLGAHVWNASICLAQFLTTMRFDCTTVEFGAGCGLVSLVAARSGARILATDKDVAALERNFVIPNLCYDFGDPVPDDIIDHRPVLALAADVLYATTSARSLAACLTAIPSLTDLLIAHTYRGPSSSTHFIDLQAWLRPHFPVYNLLARISTGRSFVTISRFRRSSSSPLLL